MLLARATSSCTRTTSRTTTREVGMTAMVVFGGPSPEHDISILTGLQAARTLTGGGVPVMALYWAKSGSWYEVDPGLEAVDFNEGAPPRSKSVDFRAQPGGGFWRGRRRLEASVVLNACHGGPGEDGTLQSALDLAGLRYTGPGAAASSLGMDKLAFGALMAHLGIPTIPRLPVEKEPPPFDPPYIIKPRFGGSSIGIEIVGDFATATRLVETSPHLRGGAVVEPFMVGSRDVNVAVRTYPELELSALEAPARSPEASIYGYTEKYLSGGGLEGSQRELPAQVPEAVAESIRSYARVVTHEAGLRSVARIDFLVQDERVWVNEVNTIPGSLAAYLWIDPPITRLELLRGMLAEAERRPPRAFMIAGADGTALRSAASIAQKLG